MDNSVISCVDPLGAGPMKTPDPFLFCVYHSDNYPAGNDDMEAPRRGNGSDFNPQAEYRMYHGDKIPGFPQHPHRGFETVTATMTGLIDHSDSQGNCGRYGRGDLQWMTAGKGIVHGEMFPLLNTDAPNPLKLFQIWLNLPARDKMVPPAFKMHWHEDISVVESEDGKTSITVWAGELMGRKGLPPPPNSWAAHEESEVAIWRVVIAPGGKFTLPPAAGGAAINRMLYYVEGKVVSVAGNEYQHKKILTLEGDKPCELYNPHDSSVVELLLLQGRPIGEPVAQYGPMVMNTQEEIERAFSDYRRTKFGGWPWKEDAMVFPKEKGRFALLDGKETYPPSEGFCSEQ